MTNFTDNVCVLIHDEFHLQQAIELLKKYDRKCKALNAFTYLETNAPYLQKSFGNTWYLSPVTWDKPRVTLSKLETILKTEDEVFKKN